MLSVGPSGLCWVGKGPGSGPGGKQGERKKKEQRERERKPGGWEKRQRKGPSAREGRVGQGCVWRNKGGGGLRGGDGEERSLGGGDRAGTGCTLGPLVAQGQSEPHDLHVRVSHEPSPGTLLWIGCSSPELRDGSPLCGSDSFLVVPEWGRCHISCGSTCHRLSRATPQQGEDSRGSALLCKPRRDLRPWSGTSSTCSSLRPLCE